MDSPAFLIYLRLFLLLLCTHVIAQSDPPIGHYLQERNALYALKATLNDPFLINNWTGLQCYENFPSQWFGIQCINGSVTGILLEGMKLAGSVNDDAFANLTELTILSFKNNLISGNIMNFSSNQKMKQIDLSRNAFREQISPSLLSLTSLESLQLQENNLTGEIPEFNQSTLREFNVSNNNLSGQIPKTKTLQSLSPDSYANNPELCGPPSLTSCNLRIGTNDSADQQPKKNKSGGLRLPTMLIFFNILLLLVVILLFILYYRKAKKLKKMMKKGDTEGQEGKELEWEDEDEDEDEEVEEEEEEKGEIRVQAGGKGIVVANEERGKLIFIGEESGGFEVNDLLKASAEGLGKGIFGNSYKALLDGRAPVVVKRLRDLKPLSNEEFTKQLQMIAELKHPNLLPLLAYYYSKDEKFFVYKYADKGNLFNRLHRGRGTKDRIPFRWSSRLSVARGIARALEYLHLNTKSQNTTVSHGNLKFSNILLDENEMVLVSDYGLTSLVAHPIAAQRMVSYKSPEYQTTKKVSKKSDVWSYGCLLLELLTGRMSVHTAPPGINSVDLCSWVHRAVREEWTAEIFDLEISVQRSGYPGMLKLLKIAIRCCDKSPEKWPEMTEVVREVENIKLTESEDEDDLSIQSLTEESVSTTASGIVGDER